MEHLTELLEYSPGLYLARWFELSPNSPEYMALVYGLNALIASTVIRSILIIALRMMGLYSPAFYRWWPRLPWRGVFRIWLIISRWREVVFRMGRQATGGFAGVWATATFLFSPGKLLLGRLYGFGLGWLQPVGIHLQRHVFIYAQSGGGKTTALITMLRQWFGSAFVIDPKGQITKALASCDNRSWVVLDPYNITGIISAGFNVFDLIKEQVKRSGNINVAVLWAQRIAQALVVTPPGSRTPYFTETARAVLTGIILHVLSMHPESDHHLGFVRDLIVRGYPVFDENTKEELTKDDEAHVLLLETMAKNPEFDGAVAGSVSALVSAGQETAGNVRSTLQEQTKVLDIPAIRKLLRETTVPLSDLKTRNDLVMSLVAPTFSIREELAPLCRLLTNMTAYTFEAVTQKKGLCLFVIDELPSQGRNETFEVMLAVLRSYGLVMVGIAQNVGMMRQHYPQSWRAFSGEADGVMWVGTNDEETAGLLSQALGKKSLVERDRYSGRNSYREVSVMDADQVKRFLNPESGNLIVTRAGGRAFRLKNEPYYKALPVWAYAADPDHREPLLRRFSRFLFGARAPKPMSTEPDSQINPPPHSQSTTEEP